MMPACRRNANDDANVGQDSVNNQELNDSLATALAEKDSLMALMNDIGDGMAEIMRMQDIVSSQDLNSETPDQKAKLRNDMALIQQSIEQKKQRLVELEKRLTQSTNFNNDMRKTIESLKSQLANQQTIINDLNKKLAEAHIVINNLNNRVDSLNTVNATVSSEKKAAQEESARLNTELNVSNYCYYAIGTKNELKSHKIIETGFLKKTKIMEGDFEKSYFTRADKRTLTEVPIHSNKVQLMSKHPSGSYNLVDGANGKVLRITNPSKFWELSNYLIIKIN